MRVRALGFLAFWVSAWALAALEPCCGSGMELAGHAHAGGVIHSATLAHASADHGHEADGHSHDRPRDDHTHCPRLNDSGADNALRIAEKGPAELPPALPPRPPITVNASSTPACTLAETPGWWPGWSSKTYLHTLRLRI